MLPFLVFRSSQSVQTTPPARSPKLTVSATATRTYEVARRPKACRRTRRFGRINTAFSLIYRGGNNSPETGSSGLTGEPKTLPRNVSPRWLTTWMPWSLESAQIGWDNGTFPVLERRRRLRSKRFQWSIQAHAAHFLRDSLMPSPPVNWAGLHGSCRNWSLFRWKYSDVTHRICSNDLSLLPARYAGEQRSQSWV
jgi:hypothetical protein